MVNSVAFVFEFDHKDFKNMLDFTIMCFGVKILALMPVLDK